MEEYAQKRCHATLLNVVPHGGRGTTTGPNPAGCRAQIVPNGYYHQLDTPGDETHHDKFAVKSVARVVQDTWQGHRPPHILAETVLDER